MRCNNGIMCTGHNQVQIMRIMCTDYNSKIQNNRRHIRGREAS